jgi:multimeric flavodoxin WrbA
MKLVIHDLSVSDFEKMAFPLDQGTTIIADNGNTRACIGCYGCWIKTPGVCVVKDGYQNLGQLFSKADDVIVISKCVYGGYSPFIKNVWDRSISYLLPYFIKKNGETHHKMRYNSTFNLAVHFYADSISRNISQDEQDTAQRLIKANCVSFGSVPQVHFYRSLDELKGKVL